MCPVMVAGYERAAAIAKDAYARNVSLKQAALAGGVDGKFYDEHVSARYMLEPYELNKDQK